jgi:hypothetical protein
MLPEASADISRRRWGAEGKEDLGLGRLDKDERGNGGAQEHIWCHTQAARMK